MADNKEETPSACAQEPPPYRPTEALSDQPLPTSKSSKMPTIPTVPTVVTGIKDDVAKDSSTTDTAITGAAESNLSEHEDADGGETQKGAGGELPPLKHSSFIASKVDTTSSRIAPKASKQPPKLGRADSVAMKSLPKKTTSTISEKPSVQPSSAPLEIKESDSETSAALDAEALERCPSSSSHQDVVADDVIADDDIAEEDIAEDEWGCDEVRRRFYSGI